jgi:hypothetical protein
MVLVGRIPRATGAERVGFLVPTEQEEYLALVQGMKHYPEFGGFDFFILSLFVKDRG